RQPELARELEVALVVRRHCHYGAGAVVAEDEIRHPHRYGLLRERVRRREAGVETLFLDLAADTRGAILRAEVLHLPAESGRILRAIRELHYQRMLGAEEDERRAVDRVDARREHLDVAAVAERKLDLRSFRPPDPVLLHRQ